jgi:hypothetical protein
MRFFVLLSLLFAVPVLADDLLPTLMTTRGKLLVDQPMDKQPPPFDGKSNGFASGFKGWRYNAAERGGHWEVADGAFKGAENPAVKHPATASYGFDFKDGIIQCEVRMNDVPLNGRKYRYLNVRTTDTKDYVCTIAFNEGGFRIQKDDNDHDGPDKAVPLGQAKLPLKLNEWIKVLFEIRGEEMCATVNGVSLTGTHPLIGSEKHSVMFVCGVEGSVRNIKAWEGLSNPDWEKNKAKILANMAKNAPAKK